MKRLARAKKRDANEPEIVKALRDIGCEVELLDDPLDLLVGYRGENFLIEVKGKDGKWTSAQEDFIPKWTGKLAVVRTPEQAIGVVTGKYKGSKLIF